jgi:hypothetical protein
MKRLRVFLIVLMTLVTDWRVLADPVLPFIQEGSARTAYIAGVYDGCIKKLPPNPKSGPYCLCYGRALAGIINSQEFEEQVTQQKISPSFLKKGDYQGTCVSQA